MPGNQTGSIERRSRAKKPSDRRDSKQHQQTPTQHHQLPNRKNVQGRHKDTHFSSSKRQSHNGLNGFNGSELAAFLNKRYSDTLMAFHNSKLDDSIRPVKYENQEKAWGNKGAGSTSAWGQNGGAMANGQDFILELVSQSQ